MILHSSLNIIYTCLQTISKGYITTNTRYITLVEDSIENTQVLKARESELCVLMVSNYRYYTAGHNVTTTNYPITNNNTQTFVSLQANIHRVYTESLMNPLQFSQLT